MKKKTIIFFCLLLSFILTVLSLTACDMGGSGKTSKSDNSVNQSSASAGGQSGEEQTSAGVDTNKAVASIAVKQAPNKTEYNVDDTFSLAGGIITVTYGDGTTADVPMTDPAFTVSNVNMGMAGSKTVTIRLSNQKTTFKVTVRIKGVSAYFDLNYDGAPAATSVNIVKGFPPARPETDPVRDGYTFYNWYADKACTMLYDFYALVNEDTTIYAKWKENGATYYDFVFDMNYYGCGQSEYPQLVKSGEKAVTLAIAPERVDYKFEGWYADANGNTAYDFNASVSSDTRIYAKWTKTKTGVSTYVFEAENTDLSEKNGPGYSGENSGFGMAVEDVLSLGASGGKYVSYMYRYGNSLEFYVASDQDVSNVTLTVRFAAEYDNMYITPDIYEISVNGTALSYSDIDLKLLPDKEVGAFGDYVISTTVSLQKGENLIQLKTINNIEWGPTLKGRAPVIDCIKLTTDAVLIWDGKHGLPAGL